MSATFPALPSEWIGRLFSRFRAIYGNRVEAMWGTVDPSEVQRVWADALGRFDGSDLREAIEAVTGAYPDYPPTLGQFIGLCQDAKKKRQQEVPKLAAPREPIPDHIRAQLDEFLAKSRAKDSTPKPFRIDTPGNA